MSASKPIEDDALIGDGHTVALCWPRFDSDACLSALVGAEGQQCHGLP